MQKIISKLAKVTFVAFNIVMVSGLVSALSYPYTPTNGDYDPNPTTTSSCVDLYNNLRYQSNDASTSYEVSKLQSFLQTKGYLNSEPTGYFGNLTLAAVKSYQSSVGLDQTGYVGPLTRAKIKAASCNVVVNKPICVAYQSYTDTNSCTCYGTFQIQSAYTYPAQYKCVSNNTTVCTMDAQLCPDGSSVGRDPNNGCAFRSCPSVPVTNYCNYGQYYSTMNSCVCNGTISYVGNFLRCDQYSTPVYYPACNPNINYFAQQNCTCQDGSVVSSYSSCSEYYNYNNNNYGCYYNSTGQMYCY